MPGFLPNNFISSKKAIQRQSLRSTLWRVFCFWCLSMNGFSKPSFTIEQQISLLRERGLRLIDLLDRYPNVSRWHMGFPEDWQSDSFWSRFATSPNKHKNTENSDA